MDPGKKILEGNYVNVPDDSLHPGKSIHLTLVKDSAYEAIFPAGGGCDTAQSQETYELIQDKYYLTWKRVRNRVACAAYGEWVQLPANSQEMLYFSRISGITDTTFKKTVYSNQGIKPLPDSITLLFKRTE